MVCWDGGRPMGLVGGTWKTWRLKQSLGLWSWQQGMMRFPQCSKGRLPGLWGEDDLSGADNATCTIGFQGAQATTQTPVSGVHASSDPGALSWEQWQWRKQWRGCGLLRKQRQKCEVGAKEREGEMGKKASAWAWDITLTGVETPSVPGRWSWKMGCEDPESTGCLYLTRPAWPLPHGASGPRRTQWGLNWLHWCPEVRETTQLRDACLECLDHTLDPVWS